MLFWNSLAFLMIHHLPCPCYKKYISYLQLVFTGMAGSKLPKSLDLPERLGQREQP